MQIKRRDFLKLSVAAGTTAVLSSCGRTEGSKMNALAAAGGKTGELPGEWKASTCQGCTTWCPVEIFVQDDRAVKVRGNRYSNRTTARSAHAAISPCSRSMTPTG